MEKQKVKGGMEHFKTNVRDTKPHAYIVESFLNILNASNNNH